MMTAIDALARHVAGTPYEDLPDAATEATRKFILDTKCNCTYECALGINIITNAKHIPSLLSGLTKQSI